MTATPTVVEFPVIVERQQRAVTEDRAFLKHAATPSALALKLNNIVHTTLADFMEPNAEDDAMVMRSMSMIEPKAFDALKSMKLTERVLQGEDGERQVIERKYEIALHEPLKAAQMLRELFGMDAHPQLYRIGLEEGQEQRKSNGLELVMTPREFTRGLDYVAPQYREKTDEDYMRELGLE